MIKDVEVLNIKEMYKQGMKIADIARATGYSDKTVRKWIKAEGSPRYKPRPKRPGKLTLYEDYIMKRMADGVFNCEILLKEIKKQGYTGGSTILRDYVAPFRRQFKVQAVRRFETGPGEQIQVDWGYLGTYVIDGRPRKVWVFVMVLGYSRYMAACCTTSMDLETLLLCHQKCFEQIKGVTSHAVYDNMKTVTIGRDLEHNPLWQKRFLDFALHYGFKPVVCTPYKPESKGKVESGVGYIKNNFSPGRFFTDLTDLNSQLQDWLDSVANVRVHGTTRIEPAIRFKEENLKQLPRNTFPVMVRFPRKVSRDCFISYAGVLYSVPWRFAGSEVTVEELLNGKINIYWHGEAVASHSMPRGNVRRVEDPRHLEGLPEAQRKQNSSGLKQCYPEVQTHDLAIYEQFAEVTQ